MAQVEITTAGELDVVESREQHTAVCNVDIAAGEVVRMDGTSGKWVKSLATTAANSNGSYLALKSRKAGTALTGLKKGVVRGFTLGNYGAKVYVSDTAGQLADAAGTVTVIAGDVIAQWGEQIGTAPTKLLRVDLP
jgi:hypothetical protein